MRWFVNGINGYQVNAPVNSKCGKSRQAAQEKCRDMCGRMGPLSHLAEKLVGADISPTFERADSAGGVDRDGA